MVDWELTAKTIYCDAVVDEVTLLLYADGTCRCTGREKYTRLKRDMPCPPADCDNLVRYREKLLGKEEASR